MSKAPKKSTWRQKQKEARYFSDQKTLFAPLVKYASLISHNVGTHTAKPSRGYATWLFTRAVITSGSLLSLCEPRPSEYGISYLDHASIAALSRALIENIAVVCYIGDDTVTEDEWECRKYILDLHDYFNRDTFLELLGAPQENLVLLQRLRERLSMNAHFHTIPPKRQKALLNGEDMFIFGRHRALLVFGWGDDLTKGIYKYLSHQTHSQTMAFQRTIENKLYEPDSAYAKFVAGFSLEFARKALGFGILRMVGLFPYVGTSLDPIILTGLRQQYHPDHS